MKAKTAAVALVGFLLVGAGSAALVDYFTQSSGTANVQQAVTYEDGSVQKTAAYNGNVVAGTSTCGAYTLVNHNQEQSATVKLNDYFPDTSNPSEAGIETNYWDVSMFQDSNDVEKRWGHTPDTGQLDEGELSVSVGYETGCNAVFTADAPAKYLNEGNLDFLTFAFDTDADGTADFQVQYDVANQNWRYKQVSSGSWGNWESVPGSYSTSYSSGTGTLTVPVETLGGMGSSYKFGVDAVQEGSNQTFYSTDPAHLWYDSGTQSYTTSQYYVPMDVGTSISHDTGFPVPADGSVGVAIETVFDIALAGGSYTINNRVEPN